MSQAKENNVRTVMAQHIYHPTKHLTVQAIKFALLFIFAGSAFFRPVRESETFERQWAQYQDRGERPESTAEQAQEKPLLVYQRPEVTEAEKPANREVRQREASVPLPQPEDLDVCSWCRPGR